MLNLFTLGQLASNLTPTSTKEKVAEKIKNSNVVRTARQTETGKKLFDITEKVGTAVESGKKYLQEQEAKRKIGNMYSDEKEAYKRMKADGISDKEAFQLIVDRRKELTSHFGVDEKISQKEKESLKKMRADGLSSIEALYGLSEYRSGFESREQQIAAEQKEAKQKAWDKHYEAMPWYKKGAYHTMQGAIGLFEGGMGTAVNTVDFLAGGTETGKSWREGIEQWNNDPMMNSNARMVGKVVGEGAVMGATAVTGGAALAGTKTGVALGAGKMMTPATTWGGMAVQGAIGGAGYSAWSEIANKGADATAEGIGKSAVIGGAVGGVATPVLGKVIMPALGNAVGGVGKVGNAGVQAFKHTAGTLDDRVAAAVNAVRTSTGRSVAHTGQSIVNSTLSAKDAVIRKFLGNKSDDIANIAINSADDIAKNGGKVGKIQSLKNDMAGLDERDLQILRNTTTEEYDEWIRTAQKALDDNYSHTPYHKGAQKANEAMELLEENLRANQIKRMEIIENSGIQKIDLEDVRPKILEDLKKTFNIEGWKYGQKGEVIPQITAGRKSLIDVGNTRDMQALAMLDEVLKGGSPAEVMDTIKILQNHLYDNSTGLRVSDPMKKFLERTTGKMNHAFKTTMGDDYAKILAEMSDDIKLEKEIERIFKPMGADEVSNRGELAMKRLSNGTTTSGEARNLALKIHERTGVDLIKESRLAQLSMDIVGDERGATLFGVIKDGKGGAVKYLVDKGRNLVANKESVARANTIKNIIGVPKDVKISGLNNAILSTKFSKNDTAMIKKIAEKISQNKPLTEIQTKNIITIKKLIEEKLPQSEVEKFRQILPHKDVGKGLTSINKKEPVMAMSGNTGNTSKKFDENFKKFADDKFAEIQKATEENKNFTIRHSISKKTKNFLLKEGFTELPEQQVTTANSIRHIFKEHGVGNEKNPDQIPVTWEDIKHIPEIQQNYDNIKISPYKNKQGQTVIIYEKIIDNHYYYLEKINHRGQLETQTMYIKNIKKDS